MLGVKRARFQPAIILSRNSHNRDIALTSNEDCWLLVGEAILRTHDLQVYASWRLASKACLGAWQHSFDATAPWLSIWPANLERYLWQASVPHFDGESGGLPKTL